MRYHLALLCSCALAALGCSVFSSPSAPSVERSIGAVLRCKGEALEDLAREPDAGAPDAAPDR